MKAILVNITIVILCFAFQTCGSPPQAPNMVVNPFDDTAPDFVYPEAAFTGDPIISSDVAEFTWRGNESALSFSYRLDGVEWSLWSTNVSLKISELDEGSHQIQLKARHKNGTTIQQKEVTKEFSIDAVKGPSIMFLPRVATVKPGSIFFYDVKAEEVKALFGAKATITFQPQFVQIDSAFSVGIAKLNNSPIFFSTIDNLIGKVVLNLAITGTNPKGATGSGSIVRLQCRAVSAGTAVLTIVKSETIYRDTLNNPVPINQWIDGKIRIE